MEQSRIKLLKQLSIVLAAVIIVLVGLGIYRNYTFRITGTNPSSSRVTVISPFFKVNFNKDLSNNLEVSSSPDIISSYIIQGKTLNISLKIPLSSNQTYTISVSNISDTSGKSIADQQYVFTPSNVSDSSSLPADQGQALINSQTQYSETVLSNGLVKLLPFTGPNFEYQINYNVQYASQGPKIIIDIVAPTRQAQDDALAWITAQGYDTSKLAIQYTVQQP